MIALKVVEQQSLFVLLEATGAINRMGTGAVDNSEREMFIGTTSAAVFAGVRPLVTPELLAWCGQSLADPSPEGRPCELTVGFRGANGEEAMMVWKYGSESAGPPPEVAALVVAALEGTAPWFENQKAMVRAKR